MNYRQAQLLAEQLIPEEKRPGAYSISKADNVIRLTALGESLSLTLPSESEMEAMAENLEAIYNARMNRKLAFPEIGDQLDAIWKHLEMLRISGGTVHAEASDMLDKVLAVKAAYPKPE